MGENGFRRVVQPFENQRFHRPGAYPPIGLDEYRAVEKIVLDDGYKILPRTFNDKAAAL